MAASFGSSINPPIHEIRFTSRLIFLSPNSLAMKTTGSIVSVNSKSEAAALSAPVKTGDQSGVTSGVVSSVKPAVTTSASAGPVNPAVNSGDAPVDVNLVKPTKGATISSSPGHQFVKTGASSGVRIGVRNKSTVPIGDKGKSIVSGEVGEVISFRDVTFGPHEGEIRFRLIHFWEPWLPSFFFVCVIWQSRQKRL